MSSTFFGLELGLRALRSYQLAQDVTAHNIANASTPGYSRQRAVITATEPYPFPGVNRLIPAQVGTGVEVKTIERIRDEFINNALQGESQALKQWESTRDTLRQIEGILAEPGETGLNNILDQFWAGWQEVSKRPESLSLRENLKEQGIKLASSLNYYYQRLVALQLDNNERILPVLNDINSYANQIASLNKQISAVESVGDQANDLRDKRNLLVSKLTELVNLSTQEAKNGQINVYIGGRMLVQEGEALKIEVKSSTQNPQLYDVVWAADEFKVVVGAGELSALLSNRDTIIPYYLEQLNQLTKSLITEVNALHSQGYGLLDSAGAPYTGYNFFDDQILKTSNTNTPAPTFDATVIGTVQLPEGTTTNTTLNQLGVTEGDFTVNGVVFTLAAPDVAPAGITLGELLLQIAYDAKVEATYNSVSRRIVITKEKATSLDIGAQPADTSNFLSSAVSGLATAPVGQAGAHYSVTSSDAGARIEVSRWIVDDVNKIAASHTAGGVPGDGSSALAIAQLKQAKIMGGPPATGTYEEFYRGVISNLGLDVQESIWLTDNHSLQKQQLENRREEISGVSLDEEMANMVKYQNSYQAAARMFTTMDEMLDIVINRMGLVGR